MAACPDQETLLMSRVDGSLELPASRALDQHLRSCAGCREQLEELEDVLGAVSLPEISAYEQAVLDARDLPSAVVRQARQQRARRLGWQRGAGLALAASLCLTLLGGVLLHHRPPLAASGLEGHPLPPAVSQVERQPAADDSVPADDFLVEDARAVELAKEDVAEDSALYDAVAFEDDDAGLDDG